MRQFGRSAEYITKQTKIDEVTQLSKLMWVT